MSPGAQVNATTGTLNAAQQSARTQAAQVHQAVGSNPGGVLGSATLAHTLGQSIGAGSTLNLASLSGGGTVRALNLKMNGASDAELDALRVRVRYDGSSTNAVDLSVSQFFGVGAGRADYKSLPLGVQDDGTFYSYWPMPFRQDAMIELYNPSGGAIAIDSAEIEVDNAAPAQQAGYLHAAYNESIAELGDQYHQLLDVQGRGHYVGNLLWVELANDRRNVLEGDDIITVDGTHTLFGTGLEDAYNGGYYYNHVVVQTDDGDVPLPESGDGAFSGLLRMDFDTLGDTQTRTDQYRWLINDPVAFDESIDVKIENFLGRPTSHFGTTAFYYLVDGVEGDMDGDGDVDRDDYNIADAALFSAVRLGDWREGDANNDGYVNMIDLQTVLANWDDGAVPLDLLGDANGDGQTDNADISAFVLSLTDAAAYARAFPGLDPAVLTDFDDDGAFTNADIAGFVDALVGGGSVSSAELAALSAAVPEPGSLGLLALGGLLAFRRRR